MYMYTKPLLCSTSSGHLGDSGVARTDAGVRSEQLRARRSSVHLLDRLGGNVGPNHRLHFHHLYCVVLSSDRHHFVQLRQGPLQT